MSQIATKQLLLSLLARRASSGAATAAASPADLLLLACSSSHALPSASFAPPRDHQAIWPTAWGPSSSHAPGPQQSRRCITTSFAASTEQLRPSAAPASDVQVGDVLDATVTSVSENGLQLKVVPGGQATFLPRRFISKQKIEGQLDALFKQDEAIKVIVTGKSFDGRLYVATRNFEPVPGAITKDKQAVFGRSAEAAEVFKQEGLARKEARQQFIDSVKVGDGPFDARVTRVDRNKAVMAVQGHLFSSRIHPTRIPKEQAVLGQQFQVWCAAKTDQGVPLFGAVPPGSPPGSPPAAAPAPSPPTPHEAQPATTPAL